MPPNASDHLERAELARREKRFADARQDLTAAVSRCRLGGEPRALIKALKMLGRIERDLGRTDHASSAYEEAATLCRGIGDPLALAHTVRHLGDLHQDANRLDDAHACYAEALTLYRSQNNVTPLELANAVRPLAVLKDRVGKHSAARALWVEARRLYAEAEVTEGVAECDARLDQTNF